MLFNSYRFLLLFLPVTAIGYSLLNASGRIRAALAWLLLASLYFYGSAQPKYLVLITVSVVTNYFVGQSFVRNRLPEAGPFSRRAVLIYGLVFNIGLLGYFKYVDFFLANVNAVGNLSLPLPHVALPLGISFFTLQQIRYIVDSYQGISEVASPLEYGVFVCFFPHLIAGPIVDHKSILTQFQDRTLKRFRLENLVVGIFVFAIGLSKKVLIADNLSRAVAQGYAKPEALNLLEGWLVSLGYTFQLYFDFSGYADMAIGAALLFNIRMPVNFDSPFKSRGMIEFWKRWHITLSSFITTYLYTPIVRSFEKATFGRAMFATLLAMLIAGLWHGAAWNFLIFGGLHGIGIVTNHVWKKRVKRKLPAFLSWAITFSFVNLTFVFFRAPTFRHALLTLKAMFGLTGIRLPLSLQGQLGALKRLGVTFGVVAIDTATFYKTCALVVLAFGIAVLAKNTQALQAEYRPTWRSAVAVGVAFALSFMSLTDVSEFLYYNF